MKIVYVVGRFHEKIGDNTAWEIIGIFNDKNEAIRQCRTSNDFVGPMEVGVYIGGDRKPWPGCYYPLEGD